MTTLRMKLMTAAYHIKLAEKGVRKLDGWEADAVREAAKQLERNER